ncbi:hypothetical protein GCM10010326_09580 [Streptomyces xanthochromogenes]|uniref:Uncharacterized protein n=2 Tax=Streptomyces xanthochromogenes TaxID=67384 RepID=A0ABQ2ZNR5_9ACTN|nr:hypothetical protein GCM10010326_09580 [Streptomyces xanthochromogenes]
MRALKWLNLRPAQQGATTMSKKQTRQNRGARTGGHDRTTTATTEAKEQTQTPVSSATMHSTPEVSHKRSRKFGHN